jgi:NTP pyrophosphatase (non-canonical NTP hydrolase)
MRQISPLLRASTERDARFGALPVSVPIYCAGMNLKQLADEVEAVSDIYARKYAIDRTDTWYLLKLQEEVGELTQAFLMKTGQARDKGRSAAELDDDFRAEIADVLCQVLLLARYHGVDLEAAVADKWLVWNPQPAAAAE